MPRIQLLLGLDDAFGRAIARGVIRYAKAKPDWKVYGYGRLFTGELAQPDGLIVRAETPEESERFSAMNIPVVDVACAYPGTGLMEAYNDDEETGRRGAAYLRSLGFQSFAFGGIEGTLWSRRRFQGYFEFLHRDFSLITQFERPLHWWRDPALDRTDLKQWLQSLSRPTALFAANDIVGLRIIESCKEVGLSVPSDISVLGVDDEDLLCELADPSLSSIRLNCEGIGMVAAELLDKALNQQSDSIRVLNIEKGLHPMHIVERESTQTVIHSDPLVVQTVTWLRANARKHIDVRDLVINLPASRRTVEKRIRKALGCSPRQLIEQYRLEYAKYLLATTNMPLDSVAQSSGFTVIQRFYSVFKKSEGCTPAIWRRNNRKNP
ncbi:xylose operon transcription regulator XylR [Gracilinema caldarium]|uniref:Transcriptional regulator, AraC family n=1 Tax=Gracilinema caldarium (strain ATCC 51460 / DSM 7334 / H1) TaxID=744872 RepID=F8F3U1_GRAC1|nr:DNA-binding transcriptional regulator [Gracilinema caldarium]AEJ20460.1 transcriptional regulator, AraC family [Gracilinema caldarium DSM 7334]